MTAQPVVGRRGAQLDRYRRIRDEPVDTGILGDLPPQGRHAALPPSPDPTPPVETSLASASPLRRAATGALLCAADVGAFLAMFVFDGHSLQVGDLVWLGLTIGLLALAGAYRTRLTYSLLTDVPPMVGRCLAAGGLTVAVIRPGWTDDAPQFAQYVAALSALMLLSRGAAYVLIRQLRRSRLVGHRTLIIGAGVIGVQIARIAQENPTFGLIPVGFLDSRPLIPASDLPVPLVGETDVLAQTIRRCRADHVIIAFAQAQESTVVDIIRTCDRLNCEIFFVPRLFELAAIQGNMEELLGVPLVRLRRAAFRSLRWRLKRVLDVAVALVALVIFSVPMLVIATAVRATHGPGVIFRQKRIGLDGRAFDLAKFRTLRTSVEQSDTRWSIAEDERLTPLGRFLRKWSLDELPQLLNILRGDMSLVGPRPERPHFVSQFTHAFPRYVARHRVPCGLTGWAQIHGLRGDTSIAERVRFDNYYIENWSLWLDVKILLRTVLAFSKGA